MNQKDAHHFQASTTIHHRTPLYTTAHHRAPYTTIHHRTSTYTTIYIPHRAAAAPGVLQMTDADDDESDALSLSAADTKASGDSATLPGTAATNAS
jgi:hypothetical protein